MFYVRVAGNPLISEGLTRIRGYYVSGYPRLTGTRLRVPGYVNTHVMPYVHTLLRIHFFYDILMFSM